MIGIQTKINAFTSPLLVAAIHNGHEIRPGLNKYLFIDEYDRLREEDPYTEFFTGISGNSIVVNTSRFEVDLNRPREGAVYRTPGQAWGLKVWKDDVPFYIWEYSYGEYDYFYELLERIINPFIDYWGYIIVYDVHSYNYRRKGMNEAENNLHENPEVNIGTGSMNRQLWEGVVENFIEVMENYNFFGRRLDVAENVKFKGGYFSKWIHSRYPDKSCVLSIEFKKIFMDEWTGAVNIAMINELKKALKETIPAVLKAAKEIAVT
jgi:N-formylglutamate deformylase